MDNPIQQPSPADAMQKIHDYARDLSYLFVMNDLEPRITIGGRFSWTDNPYIERDVDSQNRIDFRRKWANNAPSLDLLAAMGISV